MSNDSTEVPTAAGVAKPGVEWYEQPPLVRVGGTDGTLALLVGEDHGHPVVVDLGTPRVVQSTDPPADGQEIGESHVVPVA